MESRKALALLALVVLVLSMTAMAPVQPRAADPGDPGGGGGVVCHVELLCCIPTSGGWGGCTTVSGWGTSCGVPLSCPTLPGPLFFYQPISVTCTCYWMP